MFERSVEDEDGHRSVDGDETSAVVEDVLQRFLERGTITDADIEVPIERDDITATDVDRLRRAWLEGD